MRYIEKLEGNGYDDTAYHLYLQENLNNFPRGARSYASNSGVYEMYSDIWLHDALFICLEVNNSDINNSRSAARIKFKCRSGFYIEFSYKFLCRIIIEREEFSSNFSTQQFNELRIGELIFSKEENLISHEFLFHNESSISIFSRDLEYKIAR